MCKTISITTRRKVIELFRTEKNNTSPAIAEKLGINKRTVNSILDTYLNRNVKKYQNKNGKNY